MLIRDLCFQSVNRDERPEKIPGYFFGSLFAETEIFVYFIIRRLYHPEIG